MVVIMLHGADLFEDRAFWLMVGEMALLDGELVVPDEVLDSNSLAIVLLYPFQGLVGFVPGGDDIALITFGCIFVN